MRFTLFLVLFLTAFPVLLNAQNEDCVTAIPICSDGPIDLTPSGPGIDDFLDADNDEDCLLGYEHQSGWYYFEFRTDMPPNSVIEFTISPYGGALEDYDFAIYGPDVECDNLGSPVRCSFADDGCFFCPETGLGNGTTDTSEPASGDGYVAPMVVQPGEGYYLLLDNFNSSSLGFNMTWAGSAAPFLNCIDCELELFPGGPIEVCGGEQPFTMPISISGNMGTEVYSWTATNGGLNFLSSSNILNPTVTIPDDFSGTIIYTLTATEASCEVMADVTINVSPPPDVTITGPDSVCEGEDAILSATPGFSNYAWSTGESTPDISVTSSGTFTVTVTDGNGCQNEDSFTIEILPAPELSADPPEILCAGTDPFSMNVSVTGVMGSESYSWSGSSEALSFLSSTNTLNPTVTIPDNFSGILTYALAVSEGDCNDMIDIMMGIASLPGVFISGPEAICEGEQAELSATAGYPSYQWSNGLNSADITVFNAGTYTVTVTDSNGCENEESFELVVNPLPEPEISGDDFVCLGNAAELTVSPAFTSYFWSNGSTDQSATYLEPGTAMLLVTDEHDCQGYAEFEISDQNIPPPQINGDPEICPGDTTILSTDESYAEYFWNNGSTVNQIEVYEGGNYILTVLNDQGCVAESEFEVLMAKELFPQIVGDTAICEGEETLLSTIESYPEYLWSTDSTSQSIIVGPGDYSITVTGDFECTFSTDFTVIENPLPEPQISGLASFCLDASTTITVSESFEEYSWSNGDTTQSVVINVEGEYSVTVQDVNNCVGDTSIYIAELEMLEPAILGDPQFCAGDSTVLIGEDGYLTYSWSNGTDGQAVSLSVPGTVTLSVTDENGCSGSTSIDLIENPLPQPQLITAGYFCAGDSALIEVNNNYVQYLWSDGDTTDQIFASEADNYFVTVTDINGCEASAGTLIEAIDLPLPPIDGPLEFCPGTTTSLSGPDNYAVYQWSGGQNDQAITITQPGDYSLTVTDTLGCMGSNTVTISEFITSVPAIDGNLQFCPDTETVLTGETGFVDYNWSNGTLDQTTIYSVPGEVTLTVTDSNGCITSSSVDLDLFEVSPPQILGEDNFCSGQSTQITGEAGYIAYEWSDGSTDSLFTVTSGGSYTLTAQDSNLCYSNATLEVVENPLPEPQILGPQTFCIGNFTIIQSDQTYTSYEWSTGSTLPSIQVDIEGTYGLTVSNEFGCIDSTAVFIAQETELEPVINGPLQYCAQGNTTLDVGPGYALYNWSTGESSPSITVSQPGTYMVTVTDLGGCIGDGEVTVVENPLPSPQIEGILQFCAQDATLLDAGSGYESYLWTENQTTQTITVTSPGSFAVTVTDSNGCSNSDLVFVAELPLPDIEITGQDYFCEGETTLLNVTPGYSTYEWSNANSGSQLTVTDEDTYTVTVTDEFGCQTESSEFVEAILNPVADVGNELFLDCDTHSAILMAENSSQGAGITYLWTGPGINATNETLLTPEIAIPGTYQLVVTDEIHGCISSPASVILTDLSYEPAVVLAEPEELDCNTETVLIDGGNSQNGPNIIYQWFDGQNNHIPGVADSELVVSDAGTYSLLVLDTLTACNSIASISVSDNYNYPVVEAGPNQHLDCIVENADITGENSDQGTSFTYSWHSMEGNIIAGSSAIIATVDQPGYYFLTVLNTDNGCASMDSVLVTQDITPPIANAGTDMEINCHQASVQLNGNASSSGDLYSMAWTAGNNPTVISTTPLVTVEMPGTFQLQVTSLLNGCISTDQVVVAQGPLAPTDVNFNSNPPTCFGDSDGSLIIQEVIGGEGPYHI
jgi:hypothetical protein